MKEIFVFQENGSETVLLELSSRRKNIADYFRKACDLAKKDNFTGFNYQIPDKYLEMYGITKKVLSPVFIRIDTIGTKPVTLCECRQCSAYEEGSCFKYGGCVDGFATEGVADCIHGTGGKYLCFEGDQITSCPFDTDLEPYEALKYIIESGDGEVKSLKDEIEDYFEEGTDIVKDLEEKDWSFEEDHY